MVYVWPGEAWHGIWYVELCSGWHGMTSYMVSAWHGMWYGLMGMVRYMVWPGGHDMVGVMA